jgi:hypothetical protein
MKSSETDLPSVVKPIIAKPSVTYNKKVLNVLQSTKNHVRASSRLVARKNNIIQFTVSSSNFEKKTMSSTKNES